MFHRHLLLVIWVSSSMNTSPWTNMSVVSTKVLLLHYITLASWDHISIKSLLKLWFTHLSAQGWILVTVYSTDFPRLNLIGYKESRMQQQGLSLVLRVACTWHLCFGSYTGYPYAKESSLRFFFLPLKRSIDLHLTTLLIYWQFTAQWETYALQPWIVPCWSLHLSVPSRQSVMAIARSHLQHQSYGISYHQTFALLSQLITLNQC